MDLSKEKIKDNFLKDKTMMLSTWGCGDKDTFQCRDWIPLFKKMFGKLIVFASRNYHYHYGKKALNKEFLRIVESEKPDYLIFGHRYDEISLDTIKKIKEVSPNTKTIIEFGDDDFRFDDWGRYYALFFDYIFTPKKELSIYKKDRIKGAFFSIAINPEFYRDMNLKKTYDVTFIGRPVADRYDYIKFLKEKGVNLTLFGVGWNAFPEFKEIYKGILYGDDFVKVMNQSKINLNFSKTLYKNGEKGQLKGRVLEVAACNSFLLNEYTDRNIEFLSKQKEMNFKTKEELLEKINYYLKNEKEREKFANKLYQHIIGNYTWDVVFARNFAEIEKDMIRKKELPKFDKKIYSMGIKDLNLSLNELKKKLSNIDYISFNQGEVMGSSYKEYIQAYSLYISKKQISCCDYYIHSKKLGDYMVSKIKEAFYTLNNEYFCKILNVNQFMTTKSYFLENLGDFKKLFLGESNNLINEKNVVFISIPLISIKEIPKIEYSIIKKVFYMSFQDKLTSLLCQKKIINPYLFNFFWVFIRRKFIRKYLIDYLKDTKSISNIIKTF